jgi:hypothetical protein
MCLWLLGRVGEAGVVFSYRRASDRLGAALCLSCSIYALLSACAVHKDGAYRHRIWIE